MALNQTIRRAAILVVAATVSLSTFVAGHGVANAETYLDLPLVNRNAEHGPGGVNLSLPTDLGALTVLVEDTRTAGIAPNRYAALLFQYRLVAATEAAGIDLASWNPRDGVEANRENLVRSYRYYEDLQLAHRELQWAGMGGQVGADFGGGLVDFELTTTLYALPSIQQSAQAIVKSMADVAGPRAIGQLPEGLRALARSGSTITADDLHYILEMILVMQKNIFSDLMPMHQAYVTEGLPALEEMRDAGLFGDDIMDAWRDIASGESARITHGNGVLLQREQGVVIKDQWDTVRAYKGDVGQAVTYVSTLAGSPSVAGVLPPRSFRPIEISASLPDGRTVTVTTPLPDWNWSVYDDRWDYITTQLLPKYKVMVEDHWPILEAELLVPYDVQLESHRPLRNVPQMLDSALANTKVVVT
ncbi:hypothetical protein ABH922_004830 [Rhodococcus sp. 27YEA15]|uniref:hypothetical protein n=1 Tax=Rhodococcus sp. 27YEA15 TaxID=3156259 RepID=UPI003C7A0B47